MGGAYCGQISGFSRGFESRLITYGNICAIAEDLILAPIPWV